MKTITPPIYAAFFTVVLLFSSACNTDPDVPDPLSNVIFITSDIDNVTTWHSDTIYVIHAWDFYVNNTLTIESGVIVKFHPMEGPDLTLGGTGTIIANGISDDPIIFTSFKDDAHGGDTNEDGDATSPDRKDWGAISTNGLNGSNFVYCNFYYGGNSTYSEVLGINSGSKGTVTDCIFAHNDGSDGSGWYGVLDASGAISGTIIVNNTFYDNVRPLSISTLFSLDNSNVFHNPSNASESNTYNGIFVESLNEVTAPITWAETEVSFVIDDNDFWIESAGSLTLTNDVVLKFRPGSGMVLENGTSSISNYDGSGVYFTSYTDDTKKGDTNGDSSTTTPAAGDWDGIFDNTLSIASPYYYGWGNLLYDSY